MKSDEQILSLLALGLSGEHDAVSVVEQMNARSVEIEDDVWPIDYSKNNIPKYYSEKERNILNKAFLMKMVMTITV